MMTCLECPRGRVAVYRDLVLKFSNDLTYFTVLYFYCLLGLIWYQTHKWTRPKYVITVYHIVNLLQVV